MLKPFTPEYTSTRNELEAWMEKHGLVVENGSRVDGTEPTDDEEFVYNLYAAMYEGETVGGAYVAKAREIMKRS